MFEVARRALSLLLPLLLLCSAASANAARPRAAKQRAAKQRAAKQRAAKPASVVEPAPAASLDSVSVEDLLAQAQKSYRSLDYDEVVPLVTELLSRPDLSADQKLDAYLMHGVSLAVIGDPIEAETPFRLLLRGRPDYDLPKDTAPKILAVFRKVQVEERAIADQLRAMERHRIVSELKLIGEAPQEASGGLPLRFDYRLRDPGSVVETMFVHYRRQGEPSYSALALQRDDEGSWRGEIPGEWTASEDGFTLEYYLETGDAEGTLLGLGAAAQPRTIALEPGSADRAAPPPLPIWSFVATASTAAVLALAATGTGVATLLVQQDHDATAERSQSEVVPGSELADKRQTGEALAITTTVLWISTGVVAIAAGVLIPFVNWSGETAE